MRKNALPLLLAALLCSVSSGFSPALAPTRTATDYSIIDTYARNAPNSYTRSLNSLSAYLTAPARSDLAKARSIYAWIMTHIRYDNAAAANPYYNTETEYANRVLRSRRAVCSGFALLYKCLLQQAGVEVVSVKGYSRIYDVQAGRAPGPIDHEWNAMRLDGDWYLADPTWASTTAHNGEINDFYFLTTPEAFVAQHFPADTRWQLLSPLVSKAEFDRYPKIYDAYFRLGFSDDFPKNGLIRAQETISLTLRNPENVELMCSYTPTNSGASSFLPISVQRSGSVYQLQATLPQRGQGRLCIYARDRNASAGRTKSYEGVLTFTVINR